MTEKKLTIEMLIMRRIVRMSGAWVAIVDSRHDGNSGDNSSSGDSGDSIWCKVVAMYGTGCFGISCYALW